MIYVSEEFETQTGYPPEEVLGRNCRFLQGPETDLGAVQAIRDALAAETEITIDIVNYRKNGTKFWNRLRIRPLFDDKGKLLYCVGAQTQSLQMKYALIPSRLFSTPSEGAFRGI